MGSNDQHYKKEARQSWKQGKSYKQETARTQRHSSEFDQLEKSFSFDQDMPYFKVGSRKIHTEEQREFIRAKRLAKRKAEKAYLKQKLDEMWARLERWKENYRKHNADRKAK